VSAVYSDLQEKERRSNNIIISGLKNTDYRDVTGMIYDEFGKKCNSEILQTARQG